MSRCGDGLHNLCKGENEDRSPSFICNLDPPSRPVGNLLLQVKDESLGCRAGRDLGCGFIGQIEPLFVSECVLMIIKVKEEAWHSHLQQASEAFLQIRGHSSPFKSYREYLVVPLRKLWISD